ncbi:MAG: hypothetical protein RL307_1233 [Pseudomonadota bacterium]
MNALCLYAGPKALAHIQSHGLRAQDVGVISGAAGGPKGLMLGPLDRYVFGEWLTQSHQTVDLVAASIGAWRFASACLNQPVQALQAFEHAYIHQHFEPEPGRKRPSAQSVTSAFAKGLRDFYGGRENEVLTHPRLRLHVLTSRGLHVLRRELPVLTPLGYAGAFLSNAMHRPWLGAWLERVVFSSQRPCASKGLPDLPFDPNDFRTRHVALDANNFYAAIQGSCAIPFVLQAVHDIAGAPPGAHWDGGITDYHLHLNYRPRAESPIVLYPHFQKALVPGWLDKSLKWRHSSTPFLDHVLVLAPNPQWVRTLPNGKLPDRTDFIRYGLNLDARVAAWNTATSAAQQLADEFAQWLHKPDLTRIQTL